MPKLHIRLLALGVALVALAGLASGCASTGRSARMLSFERAGLPSPGAPGAGGAGQLRFLFDDLGGLSLDTLATNALPYKVVVTALLDAEEQRTGARPGRDELPRLLARYGFFVPERIGNWAGPGAPPTFTLPLGMVTGTVPGGLLPIEIEAVNLGCAGCHAGHTWDASGQPTRVAWLGMPNTSLNLEAYSRDLFTDLGTELRDPARFARQIERTFPEMSFRERLALKPLLRKARLRVAELDRAFGGPASFSNGGPGRTNGVAALKLQLGLLPSHGLQPEYGFTSIPDLGGRPFRSSLLYDGLYSPLGDEHFVLRSRDEDPAAQSRRLAAVVAFFTVSTMGVRPAVAERGIPRMEELLAWLGTYRPPPFPGPVDRERAAAGRLLFGERCSGCHGRYDDSLERPALLAYPNVLIPQETMGTDPARWQTVDPTLVAALDRSAYGRHVSTRASHGYVPPLLSGLWATAPYLHNGSVPTLWQLMNPELRPERFEVGGHRLDYVAMGIAGRLAADGVYRYPEGYVPMSTPEVYDTRKPGLSNRGHEGPFRGLDESQKRALLEYLKLL
jgi:hypothetical protein